MQRGINTKQDLKTLKLFLLAVAVAMVCPYGMRAAGEQGQSIDAILKRRNQDIKMLLAIVQERKDRPEAQVIEAIQALGQLRAVEAVPELAGIITYGHRWSDKLRPLSELYPAAYALEQIGVPAIDALLEIMGGSDQEQSFLASRTAERILGQGALNARIAERIAKTKDPAVVKNLRKFLREE